MRNTLLGIFFLVSALGIVFGVIYYNSTVRHIPVVFSPHDMLHSLWSSYKAEYLEPGTGRTLDKSRDNVTTSEGQSYTMLRAVWMDDKETFDRSWKWTKDNLGHTDDALFSWLFGKRADGSYGPLIAKGGEHTASDADIDIALALLFAHNRWHGDAYLSSAKAIIRDIWREEVVLIGGRPYLASNNVEKESLSRIVVNPSYFAPYAYREFARVDLEHNWKGLVDTSYEVLSRSLELPLDKKRSALLPPDWVELNRTSGALGAPDGTGLSTNFGFDAMRVPWRIALDYRWNGELRAKALLTKLSFLREEWEQNGKIASIYGHDGKSVDTHESPAVYGATLPYFLLVAPDAAEKMYRLKLQILYDPDERIWKDKLSYYDDNWAWFGMAFYWNELPKLSTDQASLLEKTRSTLVVR
ncbi:MAG: glycosyl hydrolase family 8 [Patescibacteria group bacterium]